MDKTPAEAERASGQSKDLTENRTSMEQSAVKNSSAEQDVTAYAPEREAFFGYAQGELIAMEEVKDETFANKVLGDGVAIIPSDGKVYAPADGMVISVFDTKHAVCFSSNYGTEILIHIGVDTVNLQGKYFTAHVKDNDVVKKGQLMIEFDREQIQKAGYDTVIPMIFTDLPDEKQIEKSKPGKIGASQIAAVVCKENKENKN